jgi:hypothetical protein
MTERMHHVAVVAGLVQARIARDAARDAVPAPEVGNRA